MINIDRLTEAELIDLNNRFVERLRFLNQMRAHSEMLEFRIGVIGKGKWAFASSQEVDQFVRAERDQRR